LTVELSELRFEVLGMSIVGYQYGYKAGKK
jgi:hypothetical protein